MKKYIIYSLILGFIGNSIIADAKPNIEKLNNRTALVLEQIGG